MYNTFEVILVISVFQLIYNLNALILTVHIATKPQKMLCSQECMYEERKRQKMKMMIIGGKNASNLECKTK